MAKKRNRYESNTMKELDKRRQQRLSSSVEPKSTTAKDVGMRILGERFGRDTFEQDLKNVNEIVNSVSGNWQTQETMENARYSVESMQKRLDAYQSYQQRYGGADLSDLSKGYKSLLRDWDKLSETYAGFENEEAFNRARTKAQMDKKFSGLSYEDVQEQLKQYDKDSEEYKYLSNFTNYRDLRDFEKALTGAKTNVNITRNAINPNPIPKNNKFDAIEQAKKDVLGVANGSAIAHNPDALGNRGEYIKELETLRNQYALDYKFDLYKEYMEAEDFSEKSQYVPSKGKDDKWWQDTSDETYEYINDVDGARSRILAKHDKYQAGATIYTPSPYIEKGYAMLTEEEIAVYNYLHYEDKKLADKFLEDMEVTLTKRASDKNADMIEDAVDDSFLASFGLSLASPILNIGGGIYGSVETVGSRLKGESSNPYSIYHSMTNTSSAIREEVGENIEEATEGMDIFGQNIPSFLYQTGMSIGDTAVGASGLGSAYTAIMGLNSAQQTAKDLTEAGASEEEILRGSIASGLFEMAFERISFEHLVKAKDADSLLKILRETAKQAGVEGSEEFFTETANVIFDDFNRGKNSDTYKMYEEYIARGFSKEEAEKMTKQKLNKRIGFALAGGMISGGVLGGTKSISSHHDLSGTGRRIRENDRISDVMDLQGLTPEESDAFKLYSEYAKKGITADNISDARIGNLYRTSAREAYETLESKKTTTEQKADAINRLSKIATISTSKSAEEKSIQQRAESLNKGEVTEVTATGNSTKIEGIKIEDGKTIVRTGEGEFDVDAMTFSDKDAKLISYAENMGETKGNLMLSQYDGKADVSSFVNSFNLAYSYGEIGMGLDSVLKNKGVLTEAQVSEIYKTAMTNKSNERDRIIKEINEKHSGNVFVEGKFDDSIIDYDGTVTDGSKVAWKDLTKTQRNAIAFAKGFSKATGVNITFIRSEVKDGKRVGKNGSYNPNTNTIEIDVYAGIIDAKAVKDSIIPTLSHEMTHWMKAKSPAMYSKIREHALKTLAMSRKLSSDDRVTDEMNRMKEAHSEMIVTEEMAIDEIVAKYCEDMLANSNKVRKLLNQMSEKEQQSFIAKVKDTFNNLMEWVNELLSQYKSSSKEAKILREYKNRLKEVSKMWDKALEEAIKSNQSLQAEGISGEQLIGENVITENTAQFSIRTYENEGRDLLHKWLENSDLSKKDKKNIIEQMDYVYDVATKYAQENDLVDFASWSDTDIIRRDDGTPILTVVVPNGEYPLNIDFSQICKKRKALNAVLNALVRSGDLDIRTLSQSDIGNINRIIKEHGFEIACALCFVDSKRYRVNEWADSFADTFNKLVKSLAKGTDFKVDEYNYTGRNVKQPEGKLLKDADDSELNFNYINEVLAKNSSGKAIYRYALAIKNNKELRSVLNSSEIISSAGLDAIKVQNELLYGLVNSHQGSAKPKLSHSENPYGYEILLDARFNAEDAYKVGGVRIQSFSDYMANMFFDYVQMIGDLSAKKLPAHAYTKEYYFAKLFGLTGIKINMSIVPKGADITDEQKARFNKMTKAMKEKDAEFKALKSHAGLDANGNYILEDETFPLDKALEIQNTKGYDKNCGIIWVGVSNAHINKMLDDENVPFIIPYHKSSLNPAIARMRNIDFYNDYTKAQNTRYDSKAKKKVPASVWSFDFYADLAKTNDPRQTAENYKTECQNRGYLPKFDEFANHPNYYKLLVDFRVYDANGNYAPQGAVKMEFPSDFNEIVGESLVEAQETQSKLDADMKGLLDEIRSELKLGTQNQQEQYSDRDIDNRISEISSEMQNLRSEMFELEKNEEFQKAKTNLAFAESLKEKAEARKALKEIKDKLGYNDLVERNAELDAKRIELIKQKEAQKEPFRVRTLEDSDYTRLKKHFGTTSNFTVAGYMLKDGSMLDFSGKHWGDSSSTMRTVDHRDVKEIFEDTNNSGAEEMINMISNGNIRLMAETGGINLAVSPTSDQLKVLERYINNFRGEVVVDIDKVGGDTIKSFTYDRGTSAKKILDDIDNYFRGGRQSELMMFHTQYSDRDSNSSSIKEQLANSAKILESMNPVATVSEKISFNNKQEVLGWILERLKKYNNKVVRQGFGEIVFDKKRISNGLRYSKTEEEILAFSAVPEVLQKGIEIGEHTRHKGRNYNTVTFASPIIINGVRWNMGVVVRTEGNNYYKVHRVVLPRVFEDGDNKNRDTSERVGGVENNSSLSPTDNISMDSIAQEGVFSQYSDRVTDKETLDFLNEQIENGEYATVYRSFQIIDGGLYAPMNAVDRDEDGKNKRLGYRSELGQWEMATESPEIAQRYIDSHPDAPYAKFDLDGVDNKTNAVAYNPYLHASNLVLNDQFSGAYRRNLVTVECRVPLSEIGAYRAKYAKDATGWADWKAGTVAGKLTKVKPELTRRLFLSRYMLPVRIVPDSEVAQMYKDYLDGTDISVPWNVVTPSLRQELEKKGVKVSYNEVKFGSKIVKFDDVFGSQYSDRDSEGNQLTKNQTEFFKDSKVRDENGNLKVMYHGTGNGGFHEFNKAFSDDGRSFFFTDNQTIAKSYSGTMETYVAKPLKSAKDVNDLFAKIKATDYEVRIGDSEYVLYEDGDEIARSNSAKGIYDEYRDWTGDGYGNGNYKVYLNLTNPLVVDAKNDNWDEIRFNGKETTTREIAEFAEKNGYDGVIISNVYDYGLYASTRERVTSTVAVAFQASQIKSVENTNPTEDADMRYSDRETAIDWLIDSLDDYLANLSIDDLFDSDSKTNAETPKTKRAKRRVDEINKRLKAIGLSFNGTKSLAWTDERIEKYLSGGYYGSSNPKYAQAYITYMSPQQFLNLTLGSKTSTLDRIQDESESYGEVDIEKLGNSSPIFLQINEGKNKAEVTGHEGRHRMYMLGKAGVERVPVLLFDYNTKYDKTAKSELKLTAQKFNEDDFISKSRDVVVNDVIPFSQGNRELIVEKFGSGNKDVDIRFSDRDNVSVYDAMGETERIIDENARLKADIETLKANISDDEIGIKKFRSLADYLKKLAGSQYSRETLGDELKEVYTYIQTTDNLQWNNVFAKTYDVARRMMNLNPNVSTNYFKEVMSNVRKDKVTLSAEQRAEAEKLFGNYGDFHRAVFGRINVVKEGTPLSEMWKEWSKRYPAIFDVNLGAEKQVEALVDIVNALKASSSMMGEYEQEEAIRHLATEIYNQFWNIASDKSDAVQKAKADHRKLMENLRKEYEQRQKEKTLHPVGETALKYEKLLRQTMQRDKAEVKKARELGKKKLDAYKDRAERNAKIQTITKKAMTLNQWLTKNSRDEHIPEVMKAPVAYLLNSIDFSSKQLLGMRGGSNAGMPTKKDLSFSKALEQVHDMVQKINSAQIGEDEITEIYGSFADFPAGFADDIRELSSSVNDVMRTVGDNAYVLNEMTLEQLETLDKIVTIIKSTVTKMNKFLAIRHAEGVANLSQQSIVEMDQLGKIKQHEGFRGKIDKLIDWGNALPYYTFKRFGKGGQMVYEALQEGWDKFAFHVKSIIDYAESVYTSDEVKEWSKDIKTFDVLEPATDEAKASKDYKPKYQKLQITVPQIMSLYALQKREQAKGHLMGGGMRVSDIKSKNDVISQTEGVILSQSEIDTIVNSLTARQKKVADALQKFMNTVCTDWGNEVSMLRFGFEGFGEENYFPIQSDKNNLAVNDETEQNNSLFRLLNMSFTKGTIQKANNRIVISDIFDVFAQHTSDMAKYNALALPVLDSFKWYNYKEKAKKGETQFVTKSLKQSMENAFGKDAQNYFTTFLRDINGEHSAGRDSVGGGFFTNAKIASVGFNMRVVALQPTSYLRASAVIDSKYLSKALIHKPKTAMAEKYCGIALWKSLGFYDINVQNGVADMIKHEETIKDRIVEASMKGAEVADKITWGYLWNACELEVRDKQKNLKVGSKEFYEAIANRLREVIYATQVVDSTMTRSHMMRSKDGRDKMLTAFASEPTLSYNMLQDVYYDWKLTERRTGSKQTAFAQNGKKMARVITAYTVTNLLCALVEAGFDAFRDDEDEMTAEEFMELYLKNFGSDMSILGKIPYAKEIISMMQGYSSSRTDTQWMQYLANTFNGIMKLAEGKGNAYTTAKNFMRAFSQATGLPFYNAYRDFMALVDELDILTADEVEEEFNDTIGDIFPSLKSK